MKYLRYYESSTGKYWLIPTDPNRYKVALYKVGCIANDWLNTDFTEFGKYIYLLNINGSWEWDDYGSNYYEKEGYTYMGHVNIEDYEIDQMKYNL